jgi:hypothetical protein
MSHCASSTQLVWAVVAAEPPLLLVYMLLVFAGLILKHLHIILMSSPWHAW